VFNWRVSQYIRPDQPSVGEKLVMFAGKSAHPEKVLVDAGNYLI